MPTYKVADRPQPFSVEDRIGLVERAFDEGSDRRALWNRVLQLWRLGKTNQAATNSDHPSISRDDLTGSALEDVSELQLDAINFTLAYLSMVVEAVMETDATWVAEAMHEDDQTNAYGRTVEGALEFFWERQDGDQKLRDAIQEMVLLGPGILRLMYRREDEEYDKDPQEIAFDQALALQAEESEAVLEGREPRDPEQVVADVPEVDYEIVQEYIEVESVSPFDFLVDPMCTRLEQDARWVAERFQLPMRELETYNDIWDNIDDVHADAMRDRSRVTDGDIDTDPHAKVTLWKFWDLAARQMSILHLDSSTVLYEAEGDDYPHVHDLPPYAMLRNHDLDSKTFWPFGDAELTASVQQMLNAGVKAQMDNMRRPGSVTFVNNKYFGSGIKNAIARGDGAVGIDKNQSDSWEDILHTAKKPALSGDVYQGINNLQGWMQELHGVTPFMAGSIGPSRTSASAVQAVEGQAALRIQQKTASVARGLEQVGRIMLALLQENFESEQMIRIVGPDGAAWQKLDPYTIRGEYRITVKSGDLQTVNPAARFERGRRLIMELAPAAANMNQPQVAAKMMERGLELMGEDPRQFGLGGGGGQPPQPQQPTPSGGQSPGGASGAATPPAGGQELPPDLAAAMQQGQVPVPAATDGNALAG